MAKPHVVYIGDYESLRAWCRKTGLQLKDVVWARETHHLRGRRYEGALVIRGSGHVRDEPEMVALLKAFGYTGTIG